MIRPFLRPAARITAVLMLGGIAAGTSVALADDDRDDKGDRFRARLSGHNEVHFFAGNAASSPALRGAVSTAGRGTFKTTIDEAAQSIRYELSYEALEGTVTQAHIHFGQRHTVGGIVVMAVPDRCGTSTRGCCLVDAGLSESARHRDGLNRTEPGARGGRARYRCRRVRRAGARHSRRRYLRERALVAVFAGEIRGQIIDRGHKH